MSEPDLEKRKKGKKPRKREPRGELYISNAHPLPTPEEVGALLDEMAADADDGQAAAVGKRHVSQSERRRLAGEGKALPSGAYPISDEHAEEDLHNAALLARTGHGDAEAAKKLIRRRAKELGVKNPLESSEKAITPAGNPFSYPDGRNPMDRVSPSRVTGGASPSSGDHGASCDPMNRPGPSELAFRHPDMRNGTNTPFPLAMMRTDADAFPADLRGLASGVPIALDRLDAAAAAGMPSAPGNPFSRPGDHIARDSATVRNGSHSLNDPRSHAASQAMKASEAREVLKRHMFPGSGGTR